jgi:hypothetical protein
MIEHTAKDIAAFTSAVVEVSRHFGSTRPWWRGQRGADWSLTPGVYRSGHGTKERNLNARFRLMAKVRHGDVPGVSDPLGWLFLMQHYRLPTRLLDWSRSPLVGLYFAVEAPDDGDSILWGLSPTRLNRVEADTESICMPGSELVGRLGVQAFRPDFGRPDTRILGVLTEEADPRHLAQQSAFTLHGRDDALDQVEKCDAFLARVRIPADAKEGFRQTLALLGISRASLFPDLENLARELRELEFEDL